MKKSTIIGVFIALSLWWAPVAVLAQSPTPESQVQSGINPQTFINTIQKVISFPLSTFGKIPMSTNSLNVNNLSVQSLLPNDSALQHLNEQIQQSVGINVPVLLQAILNGIVWIFQQVFGFLQRLHS